MTTNEIRDSLSGNDTEGSERLTVSDTVDPGIVVETVEEERSVSTNGMTSLPITNRGTATLLQSTVAAARNIELQASSHSSADGSFSSNVAVVSGQNDRRNNVVPSGDAPIPRTIPQLRTVNVSTRPRSAMPGANGGSVGAAGANNRNTPNNNSVSLRLRVPHGARIHVQHRPNPVGANTNGNSNNGNGHQGNPTRGLHINAVTPVLTNGHAIQPTVIQIPPLQPQILPDPQQDLRPSDTVLLPTHEERSTSGNESLVTDVSQETETEVDAQNDAPTASGTTSDVEPHYERFKCHLCYEFMKTPKFHAGCKYRFCAECARKLIENHRQRQQVAPLRCPTCRNTISGFEVDISLQGEIARAPGIRCRMKGCPETNLPLLKVDQHEKTCGYVRVNCRFHKWGCKWTGLRRELSKHENENCALSRVSVLVQNQRTLQATVQHQLGHLQGRIISVTEMHHVQQRLIQNQGQNLMRLENSYSFVANNPIHVFCYVVAVFTDRRLLQTRAYQMIHSSAEHRVGIYNQLVLLPTYILSIRFWSQQTPLSTLLSLDDEADDEEFIFFIASFFSLWLVLMISICCFIDKGSTSDWTTALPTSFFRQIPWLGGLIPQDLRIFRFFVPLCCFCLFVPIFAKTISATGLGSALILYCSVATQTLLFPSLFLMSSQPDLRPSDLRDWKAVVCKGRLAKPILSGLRYGFSVAAVDHLLPNASFIPVVALFLELAFENFSEWDAAHAILGLLLVVEIAEFRNLIMVRCTFVFAAFFGFEYILRILWTYVAHKCSNPSMPGSLLLLFWVTSQFLV